MRAGIPDHLLAIAAAEGRAHRENWRIRKSGERFWGDELIVPLREEGTGALLGFAKICRDLSERKAAEDERTRLLMSEKAARQEAEAANVAKDRFLAVLSHELRTPLAPVPFALSALENEKLLSTQGRQSIEAVRRNIEIASRLLGDLLDWTQALSDAARSESTAHLILTDLVGARARIPELGRDN